MMEDFMMPPQDGGPTALPPGFQQRTLVQEGAQAPSPDGQGFFDKLRSDPKLSQAMLMTGLRLMQGARPGQNELGALGDAMMVGATTHNMLKENERVQAQQNAEFDLRKRSTELNMANTQQSMDERGALHPTELAKAKQLLKNLATQGDMEQAKLVREKLASDPEYVRKMLDADLAGKQAQTAQANSGAAANSALAAQRNIENNALQTIGTLAASPASIEASARVLQKGRTDRSAHNAVLEGQKALMKEAYPDWTQQQIAAEVLNLSQASKANYMAAAQKVLENQEAYTPDVVEAAKGVLGNSLKNQANRGTGTSTASPQVKGAPVLPAGVPAGSTLVGTSAGKNVWQAPDGQRYKEQ